MVGVWNSAGSQLDNNVYMAHLYDFNMICVQVITQCDISNYSL